jgi:hypothetical protein
MSPAGFRPKGVEDSRVEEVIMPTVVVATIKVKPEIVDTFR